MKFWWHGPNVRQAYARHAFIPSVGPFPAWISKTWKSRKRSIHLWRQSTLARSDKVSSSTRFMFGFQFHQVHVRMYDCMTHDSYDVFDLSEYRNQDVQSAVFQQGHQVKRLNFKVFQSFRFWTSKEQSCHHFHVGCFCSTPLPRFLALRKAKVRDNCLHPRKRTRHERVKLAELIKKSEESYVDFQEAMWGKGLDEVIFYRRVGRSRRACYSLAGGACISPTVIRKFTWSVTLFDDSTNI